MPMGPFRLIDLVGFGVAVATGAQYIQNFEERTYKSMIIPLLQEDRRAGEATRKGFYLYDNKRKANPDPEMNKYIEKARENFWVVNEACRVLAEGIAVKAADLDIASVMGMGFPPYSGWSELRTGVGKDKSEGSCSGRIHLDPNISILDWRNGQKLYGNFFKPCDYMAERAARGVPLSSPMQQGKVSAIRGINE
ncbi:hypothetical protein Ancab_013592 [Ancistrocladus abbreviatus]